MGNCLSQNHPSPEVAQKAEPIESVIAAAPEASPEDASKPVAEDPPKDSDGTLELDFIPPRKPANEGERLRILHALGILDTDREGRFDNITQLLCTVFNVPIAAVSLRQWFKAVEGLGKTCQTGRDESFCGWTILPQDPRVLVVEDALKDVRFSGNPLVSGPPFIRFYAGAPLISSASDYKYGSLCVIDTKPHHEYTAEQYNMLAQFAELVVREIEKDKLNIVHKIVQQPALALSLSNARSQVSPPPSLPSSHTSLDTSIMDGVNGLARATDCFRDAVLLIDVNQDDWQVLYANSAFATVLGVPRDEAVAQGFWDMFDPVDETQETLQALASEGQPFKISARLMQIYRRTAVVVSVDFQPAATGQLGPMLVGIPADIQAASQLPTRFEGPAYYFSIIRLDSLRPSSSRSNYSRSNSLDMSRLSGSSPLPGGNGNGNGNARPLSPVLSLAKVMPSAFTDIKLGPLIGRGAYGRVYRSIWNGNTVAVKVMETSVPVPDGETDLDPSRLDRSGFFEALLSSHLSHPNIVHTYQYAIRPLVKTEEEPASGRLSWEPHTTQPTAGTAGGVKASSSTKPAKQMNELWLISEYCNRGPLLTAIERGAFLTTPSVQTGQPNLVSVLQTCQEIAAAMQYLHFNNIVHGDLTGGNVLLTASEKDARGFTAKVVDFGLSRVCTSEFLHTKTLGCAEYMPPELITEGILAKPADVYAFGVVMWEIYVGRRAWEGLKPTEVLKRVAGRQTLAFPPQTPHRLKILGERCLDYDPANRPTFVEVLSEVNAILEDTMNILQQFLSASANRGNR